VPRHEALGPEVLVDLHELLCVLESTVLILWEFSLIQEGLEGKIGDN